MGEVSLSSIPYANPWGHRGGRKHSSNEQSLPCFPHKPLNPSGSVACAAPPCLSLQWPAGLEGGVCAGPATGGVGQVQEAPGWVLAQVNRSEGKASACGPRRHPRASD